MKVALITPTPMLEKVATRSKYQFVLAHIYARDSAYRKFYQQRAAVGDSIIIDNGAYEFGESVSLNEIKQCAEELHPEVLVLPDARFDRVRTLELAKQSIDILKGTAKYLLGVPQGKNLEDILLCYAELHQLSIDGYGLYEEIGDVAGLKTRANFLQYLEEHDLHKYGKYFHMLGMEEDLTELKKIASFHWVDGIDSCKPIVYGLNHIWLHDNGTTLPYPHRPKDYFNRRSIPCLPAIYNNIDRTFGWANYHP